MPPQNMPVWSKDPFDLKASEKQHTQELFSHPFCQKAGCKCSFVKVFSSHNKNPGDLTCCLVTKSKITVLQPHGLEPSRLCPWDFPGKTTGAGCRALLQRIFLTHISCIFLHQQADSLPLCHLGSPKEMLWLHQEINKALVFLVTFPQL